MSNKKKSKKKQVAKSKAAPPARGAGGNRTLLIIGAVAAIVIVALVVLANGGKNAAAPSSEESAYAGRYLPAGYESPKIAEQTLYTAAIQMTETAATQDDSGFSIPVDAVVTNKIVRFDYQLPTGDVLPMIAYVRPSGALFVGVSYCPPCQGEGQRIESDGTLTCESCGTKRNLENNAGLSGACKLYPLDEVPSAVDGERIVVDSAVLDGWTAQPLDRPVG